MLAEADATRPEAEKTEALMLAEIEAKRHLAEDQRLASEQAEKDKSESAKAASETSSSDAARLDAVEQKMEKFTKEQEDMKQQMSSHGEMLKLILAKLP